MYICRNVNTNVSYIIVVFYLNNNNNINNNNINNNNINNINNNNNNNINNNNIINIIDTSFKCLQIVIGHSLKVATNLMVAALYVLRHISFILTMAMYTSTDQGTNAVLVQTKRYFLQLSALLSQMTSYGLPAIT